MDALLLDFNGVVVDDEPLHFASFGAVLAEEGIALDEATYYGVYMGFDDRAAFREAFRRAGRDIGPARLARLVERKSRAYGTLAGRALTIVPGVRTFVSATAAVAKVAVVSGALRAEVDMGLARAGIADVVDTIVAAEDVTTTKPDPEGFRLALRRLAARHGAGPWRATVIEDSLPGLAAARGTGAACVMLTTSHPASALGGADAVWSSFEGHEPAELGPLWRPVAAA